MLELYNIKKDYQAGDGKVEALKGIDLSFREKDFVAILGPSGCGKTTLLNIIGGLDHYSEGDLVIDGRSTKSFKDRDWDTYRNHSIGFVFQSYNLIPHQTVLSNVEMALTLSGVPKAERKKRARAALEEVGLGDQLKKKPGQMSGGQMQRVAIARALVNDPDIILADEPTGALDTATSVQIMDLMKKISEDHLVIMVTHNPELAEKYATRTIRMLDGEVLSDTRPLTGEEIAAERSLCEEKAEAEKKKKKPSMSFFTATMLSLNNLFTKKGRTLLTSFAGSIGIIGIALIYSVSYGMNTYINRVQEETLASYPITIESTYGDLTSLLTTANERGGEAVEKHENDAVYQKVAFYNMANLMNNIQITKNDLKSFKAYLESETANEDSKYAASISALKYTYGADMLIYTKNSEGTIVRSESAEMLLEVISRFWGTDMSAASSGGGSAMMSLFTSNSTSSMWEELLSGMDGETVSSVVKQQYELAYGTWPENFDEAVLVLDERNELSDISLYALGLKTKAEVDEAISKAVSGEELDVVQKTWTYEEICEREYRLILNADCYAADENNAGAFKDVRETDAGLRYLYNNGVPIKIVGIIRPSADAISPMIRGTVAYTYKLTEYISGKSEESAAAKAQLADPETDVFTGLPFKSSTEGMDEAAKARAFRDYVGGLEQTEKAALYVKIMTQPTEEQIRQTVTQLMNEMSVADMRNMLISGITESTGMSEKEVSGYLSSMSDDELKELFSQLAAERVKAQYAEQIAQSLEAMTEAQLAGAFDMMLPSVSDETAALLFETALEYSDSDLEANLKKLGVIDLDDPASISIFTSTFANKDKVKDMIAEYNATKDEYSQIGYSDIVGMLMNSITTIINGITYVLIAFVAISLVVSSIMIGVITLISVQERTKEIGILRALGASKRDVSSMFNAETVLIGFAAGMVGVVLSWILTIPINAIIHALTKINTLSAILPVSAAAVLVLVSIILTLIAGIIPSGSAARKDPVEALRTE